MTAPWRQDPPVQGYTVTHFDRRGGHNPLHSMAGPEFTGVGAVYAPLGVLPPTMRIAALAVLLLVAMGGCTAAWIDQQDYTPSPNICRSVNSGVPPEKPGSCVPAGEVSGRE
ncbi:hypothetical protein IU501_18510 [Nocardia otitidiscaviarum]|uniref:hypothetical protein n=1 Tax=Nocardia otitidiscaviarum TaxID=1823 RepID=UPI0018944897|nr:hypothetical protein [Nocardia otitidiscaviarum]MBF6134989.1 hypothetical protein [Nocardia otitidiscaviarum]